MQVTFTQLLAPLLSTIFIFISLSYAEKNEVRLYGNTIRKKNTKHPYSKINNTAIYVG